MDDSQLSESVMDLILAFSKDGVTHSSAVLGTNIMRQFGKDTKFTMYDNFYTIEFENKTKARNALKDGLQIGSGFPIELLTLQQFLTVHKVTK